MRGILRTIGPGDIPPSDGRRSAFSSLCLIQIPLRMMNGLANGQVQPPVRSVYRARCLPEPVPRTPCSLKKRADGTEADLAAEAAPGAWWTRRSARRMPTALCGAQEAAKIPTIFAHRFANADGGHPRVLVVCDEPGGSSPLLQLLTGAGLEVLVAGPAPAGGAPRLGCTIPTPPASPSMENRTADATTLWNWSRARRWRPAWVGKGRSRPR